MKLQWKIFKRYEFYYFKLNQYKHILAIHDDYLNEYRATIKGTCYVIDSTTNIRKYLKTIVPFLKYNSQIMNLSKRVINN